MGLRYGGVFEQGNIRYLLSSSSFGEPVVEGDYNTWTLQWYKVILDPIVATDIPGGIFDRIHIDYFIDDKNDTIHVIWETLARYERYGIFSCVDFSNLFLTPGTDGEYDPYCWNFANYAYGFRFGSCGACQGFSRSAQTYILYATYGIHASTDTLDVVRNASRLWHHSVWDDLPAPQNTNAMIDSMAISTTGKYILCVTTTYSPFYTNLLLYKGSYVEP